jgi:ABC-type lipoprotein release transport system permease subunit
LSQAIRDVDSAIYAEPGLLADRFREATAAAKMQATLLGFLAAFTTLLAGLGVYSVVAQLSVDRRRELGIRMALGAPARSLVNLMMRSTLLPSAAGLTAGLLLTLQLAGLLERFVYEVSTLDPRVWLASVGMVFLISALAAWIPARRAGHASPLDALRTE